MVHGCSQNALSAASGLNPIRGTARVRSGSKLAVLDSAAKDEVDNEARPWLLDRVTDELEQLGISLELSWLSRNRYFSTVMF